jgi:beta-phosphoglucomutase
LQLEHERTAVIFDMDGVLLDSMEALRGAYDAFLSDFGLSGDSDEFAELNGPTVPEIVRALRARHRLTGDEGVLSETYLAHLDDAYAATGLLDGVPEVLDMLRAAECRLAVASSADHARIEERLRAHNIWEAFEVVVSGTEVDRSKPDPAIYRLAHARLGGCPAIVVEDSAQGVASARGAGLEVVQHCARSEPSAQAIAHGRTMSEVGDVLFELLTGCRLIARCSDVEIKVGNEPRAMPADVAAAVDDLWKRHCVERPGAFDGRVLVYEGHSSNGHRVRIDCSATSYRTVFAMYAQPALASMIGLRPLAVSGAVLDRAGRTLLGSRRGVTEYPGRFELVPSGGVPAPEDGSVVSAVNQMACELEEETSLRAAEVEGLTAFALIQDLRHSVVDICFGIPLRPGVELDQVQLGDEYEQPTVMSLEEVACAADSRLVPASRAIAVLVSAGVRS